jgi:hypothetical protein
MTFTHPPKNRTHLLFSFLPTSPTTRRVLRKELPQIIVKPLDVVFAVARSYEITLLSAKPLTKAAEQHPEIQDKQEKEEKTENFQLTTSPMSPIRRKHLQLPDPRPHQFDFDGGIFGCCYQEKNMRQ